MASEVIERSRSHFLTRDDEGWALWSVDHDSDDPLLTFPPDDAGEERARSAFRIRSRETSRVRGLTIAAIGTASLWLLLEVVVFISERTTEGATPEDSGLSVVDVFARIPSDIEVALQGIGQVMETAFIVSTGCFLVAWLHRRWRREG